ncbi:pyrimidine utilization protein D [Sphingopyxis sp. QXT-31]|uniref:pyrimidine utilization protein D n=1 Tax=Sphingopyxis sp. QXT-31 TaxID=1357916 RepID=UPI0009796F48|nr:pyrimidine utilization protein D [Sphingopyxis sp. QXT-31]APZ99432.1 pyrimidine utilization protein D [Sphingopyxis sp. QXT-31]
MPEAGGLYYEWHGDAKAPPLILSAGLGGSGSYWQPNLDALAEHFRILLYDHRGTGRSDRALQQTHARDEGMTFDVKELMDGLGIVSAHFMGHAAGAMIGLSLALEWPERVRKLVAINGWARPDPHFSRCFDARLALLRSEGPGAYISAQPIFLYPADWSSRHNARLNEEAVHMVDHFPAVDVMERRIGALRRWDIDDRCQHIEAPTLVLAAADDMLVPPLCSQRLAERLPNAKLAMMPWGGHACNVTDPETFNRVVLDFLRR